MNDKIINIQKPISQKPCPICGKKSTEENKPFCSKRCLDVDLSRWFRGDYAVPLQETETAQDDEGE